METSAVFAVAKCRDVEAASARLKSNILTENGQLQAYDDITIRQSTDTLLRIVFETLSKV